MRGRPPSEVLVLLVILCLGLAEATSPSCGLASEGTADRKWIRSKICNGSFFNFSRFAYSPSQRAIFAGATNKLYKIHHYTLKILKEVNIEKTTLRQSCIAECAGNNFCPDHLRPRCENSVSVVQIEKDTAQNEHLVTCTTMAAFPNMKTCQIRNINNISQVTEEFETTLTFASLWPHVQLLLGSGTGDGINTNGQLSAQYYTAGYTPGDSDTDPFSHILKPEPGQFKSTSLAILQRRKSSVMNPPHNDFSLRFVGNFQRFLTWNPNLFLSKGESQFYLQYAYQGHIYIWGSGRGTDGKDEEIQGSFIYRYCMNDNRNASFLGTLQRIRVACKGKGFLERYTRIQLSVASKWEMNEMTSAMEHNAEEVLASFVTFRPLPLAASICSYQKDSVKRAFDSHPPGPGFAKCNDSLSHGYLQNYTNIDSTIYQDKFSDRTSSSDAPVWVKSGIWIVKIVRVFSNQNFVRLYAASRNGHVYALVPKFGNLHYIAPTRLIEAQHIQVGQEDGRAVELVDMTATPSEQYSSPVQDIVVLTKSSVTIIHTDVCQQYMSCRSCQTSGNSSYPYKVCLWSNTVGCSSLLIEAATCPAWNSTAQPTMLEVDSSRSTTHLYCPEFATQYSWFTLGKRIAGATPRNLTINVTALSLGDHHYSCLYPFSHKFTIRVSKAPQIVSDNAANLMLKTGSSGCLVCKYSSAVFPMPVIEWKFFPLNGSGAQDVSSLPWVISINSGIALILHNVGASIRGTFQCIVSNSAGWDNRSIIVDVKDGAGWHQRVTQGGASSENCSFLVGVSIPPPPTLPPPTVSKITQCPQSQVAKDSSTSLHFICIATGTPSMTVTFQRVTTGKAIGSQHIQREEMTRGGDQRATLSMTQLSAADEGYYQCLIQDGQETDNCTFLVAVSTPPPTAPTTVHKITQCPRSQVAIDSFTPLNFTCVATGSSSTTITFQRSSAATAIGSQHTQSSLVVNDGVVQQTLIMTNLSAVDEGYYECMTRDGASNDSCSFLVAVSIPPPPTLPPTTVHKITQCPRSQVAIDSFTPLNFTCVATGSSSTTITFQRSSAATVIGSQHTQSSLVVNDGVVQQTLIMKNLSAADEGYYECVTRDGASSDSCSFLVAGSIPPPPTLPYYECVTRDGESSDNCSFLVAGSIPPPPTLRYCECVSQDGASSDNCSFLVAMSNPPPLISAPAAAAHGITQCPKSQVVMDTSTSLDFTCIAKGSNSTNVTFRRVSSEQTISNQHTIHSAGIFKQGIIERTMTMRNINQDDAGYYECVTQDGASRDECSFLVAVSKPSPVSTSGIVECPKSQVAMETSTSLDFTCIATGSSSTKVTFHQVSTGKEITMDRHIVYDTESLEEGMVERMMTMRNLSSDDTGYYECRTNDGISIANCSFLVVVPNRTSNIAVATALRIELIAMLAIGGLILGLAIGVLISHRALVICRLPFTQKRGSLMEQPIHRPLKALNIALQSVNNDGASLRTEESSQDLFSPIIRLRSEEKYVCSLVSKVSMCPMPDEAAEPRPPEYIHFSETSESDKMRTDIYHAVLEDRSDEGLSQVNSSQNMTNTIGIHISNDATPGLKNVMEQPIHRPSNALNIALQSVNSDDASLRTEESSQDLFSPIIRQRSEEEYGCSLVSKVSMCPMPDEAAVPRPPEYIYPHSNRFSEPSESDEMRTDSYDAVLEDRSDEGLSQVNSSQNMANTIGEPSESDEMRTDIYDAVLEDQSDEELSQVNSSQNMTNTIGIHSSNDGTPGLKHVISATCMSSFENEEGDRKRKKKQTRLGYDTPLTLFPRGRLKPVVTILKSSIRKKRRRSQEKPVSILPCQSTESGDIDGQPGPPASKSSLSTESGDIYGQPGPPASKSSLSTESGDSYGQPGQPASKSSFSFIGPADGIGDLKPQTSDELFSPLQHSEVYSHLSTMHTGSGSQLRSVESPKPPLMIE